MLLEALAQDILQALKAPTFGRLPGGLEAETQNGMRKSLARGSVHTRSPMLAFPFAASPLQHTRVGESSKRMPLRGRPFGDHMLGRRRDGEKQQRRERRR